jgi:hypothetical protein
MVDSKKAQQQVRRDISLNSCGDHLSKQLVVPRRSFKIPGIRKSGCGFPAPDGVKERRMGGMDHGRGRVHVGTAREAEKGRRGSLPAYLLAYITFFLSSLPCFLQQQPASNHTHHHHPSSIITCHTYQAHTNTPIKLSTTPNITAIISHTEL